MATDPRRRLWNETPTGLPVQNLGGGAPNTAPIANRPPAQPAPNTGTPGAAPKLAAPTPPPLQPIAPAIKPSAPPPSSAGLSPSGEGLYGRGGGVTAGSGSLEDQVRGYITQGLGGVTSKAFIDRAKNQLGSAIEGQRAVASNRIDDDAIRRGLFKSGIPLEARAAVDVGAKGALASGLADILSKAEQQDIAGRESAAGTAFNLLGSNRQLDAYTQQRMDEQQARADAQAAAARAAAGETFTFIDPDTGEAYEMNSNWF